MIATAPRVEVPPHDCPNERSTSFSTEYFALLTLKPGVDPDPKGSVMAMTVNSLDDGDRLQSLQTGSTRSHRDRRLRVAV